MSTEDDEFMASYRVEYDARKKSITKAKDEQAAWDLMNAMSDISEDYYAAGWLANLEYYLWSMVVGGDTKFGLGRVSGEEIANLKQLHDKAGGWWYYDDDLSEQFLTTEEWLIMYDEGSV
jgi:hypothetical protein